jgi:Calcineurin-like phosphoesterase
MDGRRVGRGAVVAALSCAVLAGGSRAAVPEARAGSPEPIRVAAVGDIACKNPPGNNRSVCRYDDVAATIAAGDYDKLLVLGDVQYEYGRYRDFLENYDVYWGGLLPITAPAAGNHDWGTEGAAGYFRYFGDLAPGAWYSFDLGSWHVVVADSTLCRAAGVDCGPGSAQYGWLRADLAASDARCTIAMWHHPRWDWLKYQNADWTQDYELRRTDPLYRLAYRGGVDVLLAGHNHNYSRWMPADPSGAYDPERGITQYVSGAGGRNLNGFGNFHTRPDVFVRGQSAAFGFVELRLFDGRWESSWVSADGQPSYLDEAAGVCQ